METPQHLCKHWTRPSGSTLSEDLRKGNAASLMIFETTNRRIKERHIHCNPASVQQLQSKLVMASCLQHDTHCRNFAACKKNKSGRFGLKSTERCCAIKSAMATSHPIFNLKRVWQAIKTRDAPVNSNSQAGIQTTSDEPSHLTSISQPWKAVADPTFKGLVLILAFFHVGLVVRFYSL